MVCIFESRCLQNIQASKIFLGALIQKGIQPPSEVPRFNKYISQSCSHTSTPPKNYIKSVRECEYNIRPHTPPSPPSPLSSRESFHCLTLDSTRLYSFKRQPTYSFRKHPPKSITSCFSQITSQRIRLRIVEQEERKREKKRRRQTRRAETPSAKPRTDRAICYFRSSSHFLLLLLLHFHFHFHFQLPTNFLPSPHSVPSFGIVITFTNIIFAI